MSVLRQAAGLSDASQNNDKRNNNTINNSNIDHAASNSAMGIRRAPESIMLVSKGRNSGEGWTAMEGKYIKLRPGWSPKKPNWCPSHHGIKWNTQGYCTANGLTENEAKQACQSAKDCKAISYVRERPNLRTRRPPPIPSWTGFFSSATEGITPAPKSRYVPNPMEVYVTFVKHPSNNDNNNNNLGPDLAQGGGKVLQDLKKLAESIHENLTDVATKTDLKQMVHKVEHMLEEQLQEAGKHIMENRKDIKHINEVLQSILKSRGGGSDGGGARRRRRQRSKALLQKVRLGPDKKNKKKKVRLGLEATSSKAFLQTDATSTKGGNKFGAALDFDKDNSKNNNDNENDNDGDAVQQLKKRSEAIKEILGDVATKEDLKKAVDKLDHFIEEQLQEAGKHVIENQKLTKQVSQTLESILKSRASRRRRR